MPEPVRDWVLVLDDDPWAREITSAILEENGIPVHATATLEEATALLGQLPPPAVLLLDAMMPNTDGFEVCRLFRGTPRLRATRIVFVTGLDDDRSRMNAMEAGADDLLTKPLNEAMLLTRIRSLIELARLRERDQNRLEYEAVLETIGEGVVTVDDGGFVLTANRAALQLLGLPEDPLDGAHLPSIVESRWSVETGRISRSSDARLVSTSDTTTGRRFALDWISRELPDTPEGEARWTVIVRDATDQWERDHALGRLLRTVGHKLRIPLTGVTTAIQLAAENPVLDDDGRDLLAIAERSAERLQNTLLRILDFTNASIEQRAAGGLEEIGGGNLRGQLGVPPDVGIRSHLRRSAAIEVALARKGIAELVSNARAAGASQIEIVVRKDPDGTVMFAVTDDGEGFPGPIASRIFEPFVQVDRSGEAPGAGLGLAILSAEVDAAGGSTGASSRPGGPTTVWLRLPDRSPASTLEPATSESPGVLELTGKTNG